MRTLRRSSLVVTVAPIVAGCSANPTAPDGASPNDRASDGARDATAPPDGAAIDARDPSEDVALLDATDDVSNDDGIAMDATVVSDATTDAPVVVDSGVVIDARAGDAGRRSVFFPAAWQPQHAGGTPDSMGRILPDFAYSGYHQNVEPPPCGTRPVVATVDRALGDGMANATAAIRAAINTACMAPGGGAVRIPAGTYRITFPAASPSTAPALNVNCSNVVLRGEGPTTRL